MHYRQIVRTGLAALIFYAAQGAPGVAEPAMAQGVPAAGAERTADDYVTEGRKLANLGKSREAYDAYMKAWMQKQPFDLACNLGVVELDLGMARDALEHFTYCERNYPSVRSDQQKATFEQLSGFIKTARAQVGAARIKVTRDDGESAEGARVLVDGRPVGKVGAGGEVEQPLLQKGEVFVDAGSRRFTASLKGCADGSVVLAVPKGGTVDAPLMLSCAKKVSKVWVIAGISAAAVGVGVGIGSLVYSGIRYDDGRPAYEELKAKDGSGACFLPQNSVKCEELKSTVLDWNLFRGIGIGGLVFGGAAATATLVYVLVGGSAPKQSGSGVQASVGVMPGGGGAVLRGSF